MNGFPAQLPWKRFVRVLVDLGYEPLKPRRGSLRPFFNPARQPNLVSFHEPHPGDTLHKAALHTCARKLQLTPDEFVELLARH